MIKEENGKTITFSFSKGNLESNGVAELKGNIIMINASGEINGEFIRFLLKAYTDDMGFSGLIELGNINKMELLPLVEEIKQIIL